MTPRWFLILCVLACGSPAVTAHPLPNLQFDRSVDVRLSPAAVTVKYVLDMNEWTLILDGDKILDRGVKYTTGREFAALYSKKKAPFLIDNLTALLDGKEVKLAVQRAEVETERDHLRFRYVFRGLWSPAGGARHTFSFEDHNFEDRPGKMWLTLDLDAGLSAVEVNDPAGLRGKSPLDLKPGEDALLRKASAVFDLSSSTTAAPAPVESSPEPVVVGEKPSLVQSLADRGLTALFDSDAGVGVLLFAALVFGMGHAFTPGHGKTLVAAYLVGERGTIAHALALGVTTTLAHTGSVIAVAVVLWSVYREGVPESVQGWLQLGGGLLIAVVGLWLFSRRVSGKADHVHIGGGHHHHHDHHDHGHHHHHHGPTEKPTTGFGWARVILLGIGGGMIPCWDAVMLLLVAISAGRLGFAVPMLIAFSVGLAAVLVALGVAVVLAHRAGAGRFGEKRWFQLLPVASAGLLVVMGLWLGRDGMQRLIAADKQPSQQNGKQA